jgi:hypothetical protein
MKFKPSPISHSSVFQAISVRADKDHCCTLLKLFRPAQITNVGSLVCFACVFSMLLLVGGPACSADTLEAGFKSPPDSAKPQTWWHWMNGNITKEGITADLEAMKQIGFGGATIVNADCGIPRGPVPFMSPEWREDCQFAAQEANRLGLEICIENCAGWSSSGGPWNTPTNAMQKVTTSEVRVTGPANFNASLPQPPTQLGFYRDIAVRAFPVPDGEDVRMSDFSPVASASGNEQPGGKLTDGNSRTFIRLPVPEKRKPQFAQLEFQNPFPARTVEIVGGPGFPPCSGEILVSDDGKSFRSVYSFVFGRSGPRTRLISLGAQPVAARFWRVQFTKADGTATNIPLAEIELSPRLSIDDLDAKAGFSGAAVLSSKDPGDTATGAVQRRDIIDLTSKVDANGRLNWRVPAGDWVILRVGYTPTGMSNHPAPEEGLGLECDKLSKEALDAHWAGFMQKVLDDDGPLDGRTLVGSLIDSYEVGGQNWTKDFRAEFKERRGYDPLKFLPVFTGRIVDSPAVSERFLWDMRRTIADLFAENYYGHFSELCREHGLKSEIEPYAGPFESLQSGASSGLVMGEFWTGPNRYNDLSVKLAASIAHIYGKTIVGAESYTSPPEHGGWQETPWSLKTLGDLKYCTGLNLFIFHRYAMQPWTNRWPGMTMGPYGLNLERTITWWNQGRAWIEYLSRCQFLLQQGRPVADAAYFDGQSAPVVMRACNPTLPAGYDYDAVDADVLLHGARVKNGRVTLASGANYAVLILPPDDINMTLRMLKCIRRLVRAGATVVGPPPQHSPSLENYPRCDAEVKSIAKELWGRCDGINVTQNIDRKGRVVQGEPLANIFDSLNLPPDFEFHGGASDSELAFCHRQTADAEIYFVSNQRHEFDTANCTFRVSGLEPELWHPETGVIEPASVWHEAGGRTTICLKFQPGESVFVIFRHIAAGAVHFVSAKSDIPSDLWSTSIGGNGEASVTTETNGVFDLRTAGGKVFHLTASGLPAPLEVSGNWTLSFPPNWGAPAEVSLDHLISWTDHTNNGVKYFSGTATYETKIEIPEKDFGPGREIWLDLGAVKNFAEVSLNGQEFGVRWKPPFRVNVTVAAKPGMNRLVVKVTNLWPNRLIGDEQMAPDCEWNGDRLKEFPEWLLDGQPSPTGRFTFTTWRHWKKDDAPLESGLLGPVTLSVAGQFDVNHLNQTE